jgi:hypothetical protein
VLISGTRTPVRPLFAGSIGLYRLAARESARGYGKSIQVPSVEGAALSR